MKLVRFFFEAVDGEDTNVDVFALVKYPDNLEDRNELTGQIEDAICSYCDTFEDYAYEELVTDVLKSFNLKFEIVDPITFCI